MIGRAFRHRLAAPVITAAVATVLALWVLPGDGFDFRIFYTAADAVRHGRSPYPVTRSQLTTNSAFVYPRFSAWVFTPFLVVSGSAATSVYTVLSGACLGGGLITLRVSAWRWCVPIALSAYSLRSMTLGTVECVLFLLLALVWRLRDRPWAAGVVLGLAIMIKPVVAPLIVFFLITRRWRAAAATAVTSGVAWFVGGGTPSSLHAYLTLLHTLSDIEAPLSWSTTAALVRLGMPYRAAGIVCIVGALALLVAAAARWDSWRVAGVADQRVFAVALLTAIVASPIVWSHYYLLLLLPLWLVDLPMAGVWLMFLTSWYVSQDRRWVISPSHFISWPPNRYGSWIAQALLVAFAAYLLAARARPAEPTR